MIKRFANWNIAGTGIMLLFILIPFQGYFTFYKTLSISITQIIAILLIIYLIWKKKKQLGSFLTLKEDWAVAAYLAAMVASICVSNDKLLSVKYFLKWSSFIGLYFLAKASITDRDVITRTLKLFALTACFVASIGLAEYIAGPDRVLKFLATSPIAPLVMEPDTLKQKLIPGNSNWRSWSGNEIVVRNFGTFECAIAFSAFLGLILPFYFSFKEHGNKRRFIYYLAGAITLSSLFLNFTRSAYLSLTAVILLVAFLNRKNESFKKIVKLAAVVGFVIAAVILGNTSIRNTLNSRILTPPPASVIPRTTLWANGVKIFLAHPLLGVGLANYQDGLNRDCPANAPALPAHNVYLQIAAETGIAGLITYMMVLLFGLKMSFEVFNGSGSADLRAIGVGFIGMWVWYLIQSFFDSYLYGDKFSMIFWLMIGLNASLFEIYKKEKLNV